MTTALIIQEIQKLPLADKLLVIEKTLKTIQEEKRHSLEQAVSLLYDDYKSDPELTIFTHLDTDSFHEAK